MDRVGGQTGEKVDDDDNGDVVAMLPHLPRHLYHRYHVVNRFGGMGEVMGRTSKSGGEPGKVMTRKRVTRWPYCHVLHVVVVAMTRMPTRAHQRYRWSACVDVSALAWTVMDMGVNGSDGTQRSLRPTLFSHGYTQGSLVWVRGLTGYSVVTRTHTHVFL